MILKYKIEGRSLKDFSNYQNSIDLFVNLRDGNINPREVLKSQIDFKSDLGKMKKGNPKSKSEDQISVIQNVQKCFDLREKSFFFFFRDYSILLSEAKYKAKHEKVPKILTPEQTLQRLSIALA